MEPVRPVPGLWRRPEAGECPALSQLAWRAKKASWGYPADQLALWRAAQLWIDADPNARGFYEAMGAVLAGWTPSTPPGRQLPRLRHDLRTASHCASVLRGAKARA